MATRPVIGGPSADVESVAVSDARTAPVGAPDAVAATAPGARPDAVAVLVVRRFSETPDACGGSSVRPLALRCCGAGIVPEPVASPRPSDVAEELELSDP